jgi:signal peptidase I
MKREGADGDMSPYAASLIGLFAEAGREMSLTVSGTSMEPFLRAGDQVTVRPVGSGSIRRGDIIAFRNEGRVIIHRIVGRREFDGDSFYCQKGDNLDGWTLVPTEAIIGKAVSVRGRGGEAHMDHVPWSWLNPALGAWGGGWIAMDALLQRAKAATIGDSHGACASTLKRTMRKAVFLLPGILVRLLRKKTGRRNAPGIPV